MLGGGGGDDVRRRKSSDNYHIVAAKYGRYNANAFIKTLFGRSERGDIDKDCQPAHFLVPRPIT
jgi:hypothetical protein